jgi:hypothetical protein
LTRNNKRDVILFNHQKINTLVPISFTLPLSYLKVNNDQIIQITKGTYSNFLDFQSNTELPFLVNLEVESFEESFVFIPSKFQALLGQSKTQLRIGSSENQKEKIFSVPLQKTE